MKSFLFITFFTLLVSGFLPASGHMKLSENSQKIDEKIQFFLGEWKIPGGSVVLIKNSKIVYSKAFGKSEKGVAVQPQNLFRIASLSKPITAAAILKLIEEGNINLNDKVFGANGILSQYKETKDHRVLKITVRNLLQHTAGWDRLKSPCGDPMFDVMKIASCMSVKAPADVHTIIAYMLSQDLDYEPGTQFSYSNIGYAILGRIIEKISGQSYEEYVKQHILKPCEITDMKLGKSLLCDKAEKEVCYFENDENKTNSVFYPHQMTERQYGGFNLEAMDAHGGWIASAEDIAKFIVALEKKEHVLLNKKMLDEMKESTSISPGYGLGCFINSSGNWWHTGSLPGSSGMMAYTKEGNGWVILLNGNPGSTEYFWELDRLMCQVIDYGDFI